jgi:hypothetical protein
VTDLASRLDLAIAKLEELAGECANCRGTGRSPNAEGHGMHPCWVCADIHEVIEALREPEPF